jgi:hypothetical protein
MPSSQPQQAPQEACKKEGKGWGGAGRGRREEKGSVGHQKARLRASGGAYYIDTDLKGGGSRPSICASQGFDAVSLATSDETRSVINGEADRYGVAWCMGF